MRRFLLILLSFPAVSFAASPSQLVADLVAHAWSPLDVRVEWTFSANSATPDSTVAYTMIDSRINRPSGNLTLRLTPVMGSESDAVVVTGSARIYGESWTVYKYSPAGSPVYMNNLKQTELDWTNLNRDPLTMLDEASNYIAARGLVPGRVICENDLKLAPVITRSQPVILEYIDGNIMIAMSGTAMADGAVGDVIPVRVELEHNKRYRGEVLDKNRVRFTAR